MLLQILFVSLVHVKVYPVFERLANSCVDYVGQPLSGQKMKLLFIRHVTHKVRVLLCLLKHAFDRNVLILGTVYF